MKKIFLTFIFFTFFSGSFLSAEETDNDQIPDISIGITGNIGSFDLYNKDMNLNTKPGLYTGGGISIEKKIYGIFNFGSGLQYRYFNTEFTMDDETALDEVTWTFQSINIPFLFIFSFSGGESALNLVGGVVYSHIFYSVMESDGVEDKVLRFTTANQIGLTAGIVFKIKTTEYTDFLLGVTGEYYPTDLLYDAGDSDDNLNMINYSLTTGLMFRTNIFPGSK
jgi:hypothetical protein